MDKEQYVKDLSNAISAAGYNDYYLAKCLRYARRLLDNNLPVIFDTKHLALLIGIDVTELTKMVFSEERYYTKTRIPKKSGDYRELDIPSAELKYIQRWILDNILNKIRVSEFATGFCSKKSILNNAKIHINQKCIVNMDIKDFFHPYHLKKHIEYLPIMVIQMKFHSFLQNYVLSMVDYLKDLQQAPIFLTLLV